MTQVLRAYDGASEVSNLDKYMKLFPDLVMVEAPSTIIADDEEYFNLIYRDGVVLHRASVPAKFGEKAGDYGLSKGSLFTYESAGVQCEVTGAIQEVTWVGVVAASKKK